MTRNWQFGQIVGLQESHFWVYYDMCMRIWSSLVTCSHITWYPTSHGRRAMPYMSPTRSLTCLGQGSNCFMSHPCYYYYNYYPGNTLEEPSLQGRNPETILSDCSSTFCLYLASSSIFLPFPSLPLPSLHFPPSRPPSSTSPSTLSSPSPVFLPHPRFTSVYPLPPPSPSPPSCPSTSDSTILWFIYLFAFVLLPTCTSPTYLLLWQ